MSTPSRTSPTSEPWGWGMGVAVAHWCDEFAGGLRWVAWGPRGACWALSPRVTQLCPHQEHGAGPAVPRPAGVHCRHEFPHGFDHQWAHVRRRVPPWGCPGGGCPTMGLSWWGDRTMGTAPEDMVVAMTHGTGADPMSLCPSLLTVTVQEPRAASPHPGGHQPFRAGCSPSSPPN